MNILYKTIFTIDKIEISILVLIKLLAPVLVAVILGRYIIKILRKKASKLWELFGKSKYIIEILIRFFLLSAAVSFGFYLAGINSSIFYYFYSLIFKPFLTIGSTPVSLISIALLILIISASIFFSKYILKILDRDIYPKTSFDIGIRSIKKPFFKCTS